MLPEPSPGVPADLLLPTDFVTLRLALVDEVGFDAAVLLERVRWRCEVRPEGWVATYADLMSETRLCRNRVIAAAQLLMDRGWLVSENAGQGNRTLRWLVPISTKVPERDDGVGKIPERDDHSPESGLPSSYREDLMSTSTSTSSEQPGLALVVAAPGIEDEFDAFWEVYPRKVSKAAALRAYRSARKRATLEVIAAGLRSQLGDLTTRQTIWCPTPRRG